MVDADIFTEKRQHPRIQVKIAVKYKLIEDQKEAKTLLDRAKRDRTAETVDISLGGIYIVSTENLAIGQLIRLDITLGKSRSVTAFAEVIWANETGGGLRFISMRDDDVEALKAYLDKVS